MEYYNKKIKSMFLNRIISENKSYINAYESLFNLSSEFESINCKDLFSFTSENLMNMYIAIAKKIKFSTALNYNSLIKNYKEWAMSIGEKAEEEICSVSDLKSIINFKQYVVYNDSEVTNLTENAIIEGADYNYILFIKLFWEIDGQESANDILSLFIEDVNIEDNKVTIYRDKSEPHIYSISEWLTGFIVEYADITRLVFKNKSGSYRILSAKENGGYVFRTIYTKKTIPGTAISATKFSGMLNQYCQGHLDETITVNDLLMSLALKYMLINKKSHKQMYTQKRYFKNLSSHVYKEVFDKYAKDKYPELYEEYILQDRTIGLL